MLCEKRPSVGSVTNSTYTQLRGLYMIENTEYLNNNTFMVFQAWKRQQTVDQFQSNNEPNIKHMQLHQPDLSSIILPPPVVWSYSKWLMNVSRGCHRSLYPSFIVWSNRGNNSETNSGWRGSIRKVRREARDVCSAAAHIQCVMWMPPRVGVTWLSVTGMYTSV